MKWGGGWGGGVGGVVGGGGGWGGGGGGSIRYLSTARAALIYPIAVCLYDASIREYNQYFKAMT